jgi:hypothetical protein
MLLADALDLFKYWERTPPAFVSLNRLARTFGAVPVDAPAAATLPAQRRLPELRADHPDYVRPTPSSREEVLAMQARFAGATR